ncbi:energy-coupling factor ABC transporter ATP-binding protein [Subtercola sp. PAMC28395]|nr:energy-coupling factor ABC transporter ATP-binding protein [Subtercola sp. PAMC28395]
MVFDDVSVEFAARPALKNVSVALGQKRIAVIGSNGSGKSTFARLLNGLVTPTSGSVRVHGLDPVKQGKELRRTVGFIFSNPDVQIVMPTVAEDVAFSLRGRELGGRKLSHNEIATRVAEALETFGLTAHADAPAHSLSGGQKQLLALCAVLITDPALVVADEPTALLDAANTRLISARLLDTLPQQVVLVTHDLALAARCDVAIWFEGGRILDIDEPATVIDSYTRDHS